MYKKLWSKWRLVPDVLKFSQVKLNIADDPTNLFFERQVCVNCVNNGYISNMCHRFSIN